MGGICKTMNKNVGFDILAAVTMMSTVFWDAVLCSLVKSTTTRIHGITPQKLVS
jgi:hypothetical protein